MVDKYGDRDGDTLDNAQDALSFSDILKQAEDELLRQTINDDISQQNVDLDIGVIVNPWDMIRDSMLKEDVNSKIEDTLEESNSSDGTVEYSPWDLMKDKIDKITDNRLKGADDKGNLVEPIGIEPIEKPDVKVFGDYADSGEYDGDRNEGLSSMSVGTGDSMIGDTFVEGQAPMPKGSSYVNPVRPPVNLIAESRYNKMGGLLEQIKEDNVQEDYAELAVVFESILTQNMDGWGVTEEQLVNDPAYFKDFMVKQSIDTVNAYYGYDQFSINGSGYPRQIVDTAIQVNGVESDSEVVSKFMDGFEGTYGKRMDEYITPQIEHEHVVDSQDDLEL